ncbi:hypothetical protein WA026_013214 [Henosepilachna vigintioctopunctata]|uniref:Uncharacterized protein n=1 Tax=Henosepilachna vigintioctopunctata TaxID=420089 RepID=A0AAW1UB85_9CUCU
MFETVSLRIIFLLAVIIVAVESHRVYHRIHVPTKIKTIYHTKIIKVPEHHHYIHEKEKIVPVETHHHHSPLHDIDTYSKLKDDIDDFEYEQAIDSYKHHENFEFESTKYGSDFIGSGSRKIPKVHKKSRARPRRVKHKIIKLPNN